MCEWVKVVKMLFRKSQCSAAQCVKFACKKINSSNSDSNNNAVSLEWSRTAYHVFQNIVYQVLRQQMQLQGRAVSCLLLADGGEVLGPVLLPGCLTVLSGAAAGSS